MGVNQVLASDFVTMTANLQRLSETERLVVLGILKDMESEIVQVLYDNPKLTSFAKARYNALLKQTQETIKTAYTSINSHSQQYLTGVASAVVQMTGKDFTKFGIPLQSVALTNEQYASLASRMMLDGAPNKAWWSKQSLTLQDNFVRQMRIGYAQSETVDQLVKRVRGTATGKKNQYIVNDAVKWFNEYQGGIMDTGTRQAEALVRTATQQISGDAKREFFQANSAVIKGIMQVSTLDMRTTIQCAARDGKMWTLEGEPINHTIPYDGGIPLHWNCRSTEVPVTKSWAELANNPKMDEDYLKRFSKSTRASMDGQVPSDMTFDSWFNGLSEVQQISYLGPTKFTIWQEAGLTFSEMVNQQGNPLTLGQLAEMYGFQMVESLQSGMPNIPTLPQSALYLERQTQAAAAKQSLSVETQLQTEFNALQTKNTELYNDLTKNKLITKDMPIDEQYNTLNYMVRYNVKSAESLKVIEAEIKTVLADTSLAPDSVKFIAAKEQEFILKQVKQMNKQAYQIDTAYNASLDILRTSNAKAKADFAKLLSSDNLTSEAFQIFKSNQTNIPYWDYKTVVTQFNEYMALQDAKVTKLLLNIAPDDIYFKEAVTKILPTIEEGKVGSALVTYNKAKALALTIEKNEAVIAKHLTTKVNSTEAYKKIFLEIEAKHNNTALPSLLKKEADAAYILADKQATKLLAQIETGQDNVKKLALKQTQQTLGPFSKSNQSAIKYLEAVEASAETITKEIVLVAQEAVTSVSNATLTESFVTLGNKTYNLTNAAELKAYKAYKSTLLSNYKKAVITGKTPSETQKALYATLTQAEKTTVDNAIFKATAKVRSATLNATPTELQFNQMEYLKNLGGSNNAKLYRDRVTGQEYAIKFLASEDIARNELLAGKLYAALDMNVPELTLIYDGKRVGVASKFKNGLIEQQSAILAKAPGTYEGFGVDAWLSNWDVIGLNYDNLALTSEGTAFRVDVGGALRYRAQGGLKGNNFGRVVGELESLREMGLNPEAASVFKNIKQSQIEIGVRKVLQMPDEQIRGIVAQYGPLDGVINKELADTLIARKAYLAEKYPHLLQEKIVAMPSGRAAGVTAREVQLIENGRINGYTLAVDKDLIEDQSLLLWFEKNKLGKDVTGARFKFTEKAHDTIVANVTGIVKDQKMLDKIMNEYELFLHDFKSSWFTVFRNRNEVKNIANVTKEVAQLEKQYKSITMLLKKYNPEYAKEFTNLFNPAVKDLSRTLLTNNTYVPLGTLNTYGPYFRDVQFNPIVRSKTNLQFKKVDAKFQKKTLINGHATQTNNILKGVDMKRGIWGEVYETTLSDGTRVRIWLDEKSGGTAIFRQVEILTPGKGQEAIKTAMNLIEKELKLSIAPSTALDAEELYLTMIARNSEQFNLAETAASKYTSQAQRVEYMQKEISKALKVPDVTKLPDYNIHGTYEAFEQGARRWVMPGVETQKEWQTLFSNFTLRHEVAAPDLSVALDEILSAGGTMTTTTDKLRKGIPWLGKSPGTDMGTGGADYFFTRIFSKTSGSAKRANCIYWDTSQLKRLDRITYNRDMFGRSSSKAIQNNGFFKADDFMAVVAKEPLNETMFKKGLSLFDGLDFINCSSENEARKVYAVFKKHGWVTTWVDGRPMNEIIKANNSIVSNLF